MSQDITLGDASNTPVEHVNYVTSAGDNVCTKIILDGVTIWEKPDMDIELTALSYSHTNEKLTITVALPTLINSWKYQINDGSLSSAQTSSSIDVTGATQGQTYEVSVHGYRDGVLKGAQNLSTADSAEQSRRIGEITIEDTTTAMTANAMDGMVFSVARNPGRTFPTHPYTTPDPTDNGTYTLRAGSNHPGNPWYSTYTGTGSPTHVNNTGTQSQDQWWFYSQTYNGTGNSIWTGFNIAAGGMGYQDLYGPAGNYHSGGGGWSAPLYAGGPISNTTFPSNGPAGMDTSGNIPGGSLFTTAGGIQITINSSSVNIPHMGVGATITATKPSPVANSKGGGHSWWFNYPGVTHEDYKPNAWVIARVA